MATPTLLLAFTLERISGYSPILSTSVCKPESLEAQAKGRGGCGNQKIRWQMPSRINAIASLLTRESSERTGWLAEKHSREMHDI